MVYPVSLHTIQKFESSSINSSMLYILIKSYINSKLSLALNVPSVTYIVNVLVHKMYGIDLDYIL